MKVTASSWRRISALVFFVVIYAAISGCAVEKARSSVAVFSGYNRTSIHIEVPTNKVGFDVHGTSRFFYRSDSYTLTIPRGKDDVSGEEIALKTGYGIETTLAIGSKSQVRIVGQAACVVNIALFDLNNEPYPINGQYKAERCNR